MKSMVQQLVNEGLKVQTNSFIYFFQFSLKKSSFEFESLKDVWNLLEGDGQCMMKQQFTIQP